MRAWNAVVGAMVKVSRMVAWCGYGLVGTRKHLQRVAPWYQHKYGSYVDSTYGPTYSCMCVSDSAHSVAQAAIFVAHIASYVIPRPFLVIRKDT